MKPSEFWDKAAQSDNLRNEWICDKNVTDEECLRVLAPIGSVFENTHNGTLNILDLGCGIGRLAVPIANRFIDFKVYGLDVSPKMIEKADTAKNFIPKVGDGETIPFDDSFFMAIYSMGMFQHIPDHAMQKYIAEVYRVLRPKGIFRFQFVWEGEEGPMSYNRPVNQVEEWLRACKFTVHATEYLIYPQWAWITAIK